MATSGSVQHLANGLIDSEAFVEAVQRLPEGERVGAPGLKPKQQTALTALASGCTIGEAAELAGVHRNTASRWFNHDAAFRVALDALCDEMREESHLRLRNTTAEACRVVEAAVFGGNVAVSLQVLRAMGTFEMARPQRTEESPPCIAAAMTNDKKPMTNNSQEDKSQEDKFQEDKFQEDKFQEDKFQEDKFQEDKFRPENRISQIFDEASGAAFPPMFAAMFAWLTRVVQFHAPVRPSRPAFQRDRKPRRCWVVWARPTAARRCLGLRAACTQLHQFAETWANDLIFRRRAALDRRPPLRA